MFARIVISIFLIAAGIASPWLVKDWMDWRADEERADRLYDRVTGLSDRLKQLVQTSDQGSLVSVESTDEASEEADQEPYPFASKTLRMLKGVIPASMATQASPNHPYFKPAEVHATASSKLIIEETKARLDSELGSLGLAPGDPVFIRVFKEEHELEVWLRNSPDPDYTLFKVYRILDWSGGPGPKLQEGDGQTPEGFYFISRSRLRPETRHHLGMDIGFPNDFDSFHGRGGSGIMIHGGGTSRGSYALSPDDMNEVFTLATLALESGQTFFRVNAFPFRMTDKRMEKEWKRQPRWIDFWVNLKEGYDFFENVNVPPDVSVNEGNYEFRIH